MDTERSALPARYWRVALLELTRATSAAFDQPSRLAPDTPRNDSYAIEACTHTAKRPALELNTGMRLTAPGTMAYSARIIPSTLAGLSSSQR